MRTFFATVLGLVLLVTPALAQTPATADDGVIDDILSQKVITWGNAAWLLGRTLGVFDEGTPVEQAAARALAAGWAVSPGWKTDDPVDLQAYSWLVMKGLNLTGGLLYGLLPGPRYAMRELVFLKILPPTADPNDRVSGETAMRYLQAAQDWKGAHR